MQIKDFITKHFGEALVVLETVDTTKLGKAWQKVLKSIEKEESPETKRAKEALKDNLRTFKEIENLRLRTRREVHNNKAKLEEARRNDKQALETIINRYSPEKLPQELERLKTLPIAGIEIVENEKKGAAPVFYIFTKMLTVAEASDEEINLLRSPYESPSEWRSHKARIKKVFGKEIGQFLIKLDFASPDERRGLHIINLTQDDGEHQHPCVTSNSVCFGNQSYTFTKLCRKYQLFDMVDLIIDLLTSATTRGPYIEWHRWFKQVKPVSLDTVRENLVRGVRKGLNQGSGVRVIDTASSPISVLRSHLNEDNMARPQDLLESRMNDYLDQTYQRIRDVQEPNGQVIRFNRYQSPRFENEYTGTWTLGNNSSNAGSLTIGGVSSPSPYTSDSPNTPREVEPTRGFASGLRALQEQAERVVTSRGARASQVVYDEAVTAPVFTGDTVSSTPNQNDEMVNQATEETDAESNSL